MKKYLKFAKWLALVLLGLGILLFAALYWMLETTAGASFAYERAKTLALPYVELEGDIVSGSLADGFATAGHFSVNVPEVVSVSSDRLDISYSLWNYLRTGTVIVTALRAPKLKVALNDAVFAPVDPADAAAEEESSGSSEPFRLDIPVRAVVRHLVADDFAFTSQIVDVFADDMDLAASCDGDYAGVTGGKMAGVTVHLKMDGIDAMDDGQAPEESAPSRKLKESFGGESVEVFPTIDLPLDTEIRRLLILNGRYYMDGFDTGTFDAYVDAGWLGHTLDVKRVAVAHAMGKAAVAGRMDFKDHFGLGFDLSYHGSESKENCTQYGGVLCGLQGRGRVGGSLGDIDFTLENIAPQILETSGHFNALSGRFPFVLKASSPALRYPLFMPEDTAGSFEKAVSAAVTADDENATENPGADGDSQKNAVAAYLNIPAAARGISGRDLKLELQGSLADGMQATASAVLRGYGFDDLTLKVHADTAVNADNSDSLEAKGHYFDAPFTLSFKGDFTSGSVLEGVISPEITLSGALNFLSENAQGIAPLLKGPAALAAQVGFRLGDNGELGASVEDLLSHLSINGSKAQLGADRLAYSGDGLEIDRFSFSQGVNGAEISGELSESSTLNGRVALRDLTALLPDAHGAVDGSFKLKGALSSPALEAFFKSDELGFGESLLKEVKLNARFDSERERGGVMLLADSVRLSESLQPSRKCALDLSGALKAHALTLSCGGRNRGFVNLQGGYDAESGSWHGVLKDLLLESEFSEPVSLTGATAIDFNLNDASGSIAPFVLQNRNRGSLSFERSVIDSGRLKTAFSLRDLDLKAFSEFYSDAFRAAGTLQADVRLEALGGDPAVDAEVSVNRGRVMAQGAFLVFERLKADAKMRGNSLALGLDAQLARDFGGVSADIRVGDPAGQKTLSGKVQVKSLNLEPLGGIGDGFNELSGSCDADLDVGGTLLSPKLFGRVEVSGSAEPRYDIGRVGSFDLGLDVHGSSGDLEGTFALNEGTLNLSGSLDWESGARGSLRVTADELPVFLMGYGSCLTSVDVNAALDEVLSIRGRVAIPSADIRVQSVAGSGLTPSKDEVVVGKQGGSALLKQHRARQRDLPMSIDVDVALGDRIKLEAMGLKAGIEGSVRVKKEVTDAVPQGSGRISLVDGMADLYGHRFLVSYADTIFNGNITDPKISAEVIADPSGIEDDVTAGIRITGNATDPDIALFSRPAMSQNEILSYLLYGHGLEKSSNDSDSSSSQLLLALGLGSTSGLLNSIAGAFGMNSLQFGSSGSGEQTQVGVQTYLTNKIMISYGYGVFTSVGEFKLRYELMRKLYAEFVSSLDQAVDLIYSFEFD